jgi:Amt family ammonium transporter
VFGASALVWALLKKTIGIRVSREEELEGLDIGEHGNLAYPDFAFPAPAAELGGAYAEAQPAVSGGVAPEAAIPVVNQSHPGAKMTKVTIIAKQSKFEALKEAFDQIGITGITVTNVLGYGVQGGKQQAAYRGVPMEEPQLLPKIQIDVVISKVPAEALIEAVKKVLYTGNIGDGKIFVYNVENVVKVRTGEEGYDALQDIAPGDE